MSMLRFRDTISRTQTSLRTMIGSRRWWLRYGLPALAGLLILAHGWWTYTIVHRSAEQAVADELVALRDAITTSIHVWLNQQKTFVNVLASQPHLHADVKKRLELLAQGANTDAVRALAQQQGLRAYLTPILEERRYTRFRIITPDGIVLASNLPELIGRPMPICPQEDLVAKLMAGEAVVTRPFKDRVIVDDPKKGKDIREEPAMMVLAPLKDAAGKTFAILSFQLLPQEEFTRILNASRSGKTLEAYAFDSKGLFLTSSRFDENLRQIGLIPPEGSSILTLEMRNPGADLTKGGRPSTGRYQQPLTALAAAGTAGQTVVLAEAYDDYRGVPTVGACTWLPEYDFGIAIEEDAAEAFAPLQRLRFAFGTVFALLVLAGVAATVAAFVIAAQQKKLWKAIRESKRLGHYTLDEKLGEGGMGEVYRGSHALLRRQVAIKLLKPELSSDRALARFEREVQLTSRLQHPNTIAVYDYGRTDEGVFYYVMEYLEGVSLEKLIRDQGPQPESRVIHLLMQACGSLEEAHKQELIHRDIKPANMVLCKRHGQCDVVKVLDFGLVKDIGGDADAGATLSEGITGTPLYLAPEAIQNPDVVGPGRDIYALGATGYWLVTGKTVFEGRNLLDLCQKHVQTAPIPPSERIGRQIEPELEAIILKCLAKKPEDRYPNVRALAEALERCPSAGKWTRADAEAAWQKLQPATDAAMKETLKTDVKPTPPSPAATLAATMDFARPE